MQETLGRRGEEEEKKHKETWASVPAVVGQGFSLLC